MDKLGTVTNRAHDGMFVVICDSQARYGGWDTHGDRLSDEGSLELDLDGVRGFVEEGHGGRVDVYRTERGELVLNNEKDTGIPADQLGDPRTELLPMGEIDVPSGKLTIASAYPALNMEARGNHAGIAHAADERLDVEVAPGRFRVARAFTAGGNFVVLERMP